MLLLLFYFSCSLLGSFQKVKLHEKFGRMQPGFEPAAAT